MWEQIIHIPCITVHNLMFRFWYRVYIPLLPETPCWARSLLIPHGHHCLEECFPIWCLGTRSRAVQKHSENLPVTFMASTEMCEQRWHAVYTEEQSKKCYKEKTKMTFDLLDIFTNHSIFQPFSSSNLLNCQDSSTNWSKTLNCNNTTLWFSDNLDNMCKCPQAALKKSQNSQKCFQC